MSNLLPKLSNSDLVMFFDDHHDEISDELSRFAAGWSPESYQDGWLATRASVRQLAAHNLLSLCIPERDQGRRVNQPDRVDTRALTLTRECLGYLDGLLDSAFATQGLGSFPIVIAGDATQRARYLPEFISGERIGAFALIESGAHGDLSHIKMRARREASGDYILSGEKSFVINAGVASQYIVFATTDSRKRAKGITAFIVEAGKTSGKSKGKSSSKSRDQLPGDNNVQIEPFELIAPHPVGTLTLRRTRVPATRRLGAEGEGLKIARETLNMFRLSIAGTALGMARRALDEGTHYAVHQKQFGAPLIEQQHIASALAESATELDAARLLVYRAAYLRDMRDVFDSEALKEVAMAKLYATEAAQRIVDRSVQIQGELGLKRGSTLERLYREIRALRIYEGTSALQQGVIARHLQTESEETLRDES